MLVFLTRQLRAQLSSEKGPWRSLAQLLPGHPRASPFSPQPVHSSFHLNLPCYQRGHWTFWACWELDVLTCQVGLLVGSQLPGTDPLEALPGHLCRALTIGGAGEWQPEELVAWLLKKHVICPDTNLCRVAQKTTMQPVVLSFGVSEHYHHTAWWVGHF